MCKTVDTPLGKIEYSISGRGKSLVFIHGGHSNCRETLFQKGYDENLYQLITPSRPGYGMTPLNNLKQPGDAAALIAALLDKIGIKNCIVIGISAGGLTALELAANYPKKIEKMILISAVTKKWLHPQDEIYSRGFKMFSPGREKFSWLLFRTFFRIFPKTMTRVMLQELSTKNKQRIEPSEIDQIKNMTFKQRSGQGFITDLDQDIDEGVLERIQCPVLILHSRNDRMVSIDMATHAHGKIKNSELKIYDNKWGHLLWVGDDSQSPIKDVGQFITASITDS